MLKQVFKEQILQLKLATPDSPSGRKKLAVCHKFPVLQDYALFQRLPKIELTYTCIYIYINIYIYILFPMDSSSAGFLIGKILDHPSQTWENRFLLCNPCSHNASTSFTPCSSLAPLHSPCWRPNPPDPQEFLHGLCNYSNYELKSGFPVLGLL